LGIGNDFTGPRDLLNILSYETCETKILSFIKVIIPQVAGEIHELTNLLKTRNKNQEIQEHVCEIPHEHFRM